MQIQNSLLSDSLDVLGVLEVAIDMMKVKFTL